jgi:hypothetical protein
MYNLRNPRSSIGLVLIALANGGLYSAVFNDLAARKFKEDMYDPYKYIKDNK